MAGLSKKEFEKLYAIDWHDGILDDICLSMGKDKGDIELKVRIYDNPQTPLRKPLKLKLSGVQSCLISCDINDLLDNLYAGNISIGFFKPVTYSKKLKSLTFHLYLCEGYIQITAKDVKMTKIRG